MEFLLARITYAGCHGVGYAALTSQIRCLNTNPRLPLRSMSNKLKFW